MARQWPKKGLLFVAAMLLCGLGFVLPACGLGNGAGSGTTTSETSGQGPSAGSTGEPIKIGAVLPLTAAYGEQGRRGMEAAERFINENGGILGGRRIQVIFEDDEQIPERGVAAFEKLITRDQVSYVSGGINSSVVMAQKEVSRQYEILHVVTTAKAPAITEEGHDLLIRLNSTNDMDGDVFHRWIADELGVETVAVLAENTDYGQAEIGALQRNWSNNGPHIVRIERFEQKATDLASLLTNVKASDPDAVYVASATIETYSTLFRQFDELQINAIKLLAPGNLNDDFIKLAGDAAEGVISLDIYITEFDNPQNSRFIEVFEAQHGYKPQKIEMLGWETILIPVMAMEAAGTSEDHRAIVEAIRSTTWETPRGRVAFDDKGQAVSEEAFVQIVRDGRIARYQ